MYVHQTNKSQSPGGAGGIFSLILTINMIHSAQHRNLTLFQNIPRGAWGYLGGEKGRGNLGGEKGRGNLGGEKGRGNLGGDWGEGL